MAAACSSRLCSGALATARPAFPDEADPETIVAARAAFALLIKPELTLDKTGPADAVPGDALNYGLSVKNIGDGPTLGLDLTDTKPDASTASFTRPTLVAEATWTENATFSVACTVADGTLLTNAAAVTGKDMLGTTFTANDSVTTTIHAPVLTLAKIATPSVGAGEAITYRLTYQNTGSGGATNVVVVDKLPAGVYYSSALDLGSGPLPTSATLGVDGRWTLTWNVGAVGGSSSASTIEFTARPTLLFTGGENLINDASLTFTNGNGCTYAPVTASAATAITVVLPSEDPLGLGYWRTHPEAFTAEYLARIQATDQRFDGADGSLPNGALSLSEVAAVLIPGGNMDKVLEEQLLATYMNLSTRRINAGTEIESRLAARLGIGNVADAAHFGIATLGLPVNSSTRGRFSDSTTLLDQINANRVLIY